MGDHGTTVGDRTALVLATTGGPATCTLGAPEIIDPPCTVLAMSEADRASMTLAVGHIEPGPEAVGKEVARLNNLIVGQVRQPRAGEVDQTDASIKLDQAIG